MTNIYKNVLLGAFLYRIIYKRGYKHVTDQYIFNFFILGAHKLGHLNPTTAYLAGPPHWKAMFLKHLCFVAVFFFF